MSIFSRLSDIVNSNITALLDRAEDPEKMVRLIIQEMEETLVEVRTQSARAIAERSGLERRREALAQEVSEWERRAEVALRKDREDLARAALLEQSRTESALADLDEEIGALRDAIDRLSGDIHQLQEKLSDARTRQKSLALRTRTAQTQLKVRKRFSAESIDQALDRFDHYERRMDDLEGQVAAYDLGRKSLSDEIAELEEDDKLNEALAALKAKVKAPKDSE